MLVERDGHHPGGAHRACCGAACWRLRASSPPCKRREENRQILERIVSESHDGVFGATIAGIITSWNSAAERITGYAPQEALDQHISLLFGEKISPEASAGFDRACRGEPTSASEIICRAKDGRSLELCVRSIPILAADGTLESVTFVVRDITEQKRSESALRYSEERFRQVAENLPGVLWVADLSWKFLYISPGYESVYHRPAKDFLENQSSFLEFVHPDDVAEVVANYRTRPRGVPFEEEMRILLPDGNVCWIRNRAFPVRSADGHVEGMTGLSVDITESKRVEEALRGKRDPLPHARRTSQRRVLRPRCRGPLYQRQRSGLPDARLHARGTPEPDGHRHGPRI